MCLDEEGLMTQTGNAAPHAAHESHGHSVAAWTSVTAIMVGFLVSCLGVAIANAVVFWAGAVIVVLGALSGKVLAAMGFGISGKPGA